VNPAGFLADILSEPDTLAGVLDAYEEAPPEPLAARRVLFLGMGSSRFAALAAASRLRHAGVDAYAEYSSAAELPPASPDLAVVAISATGSTPETVAAAAGYRGVSRVVAVTNRPDGPLAEVSDHVLALGAGEERGGIACTTYQATVAVLLMLAGVEPVRLRPAVTAVRHLVESRDRWVGPALDVLGGGPLDVVAPAERLSSAEQSALMLREAPRIRAVACETGDWLHVDVYLSRAPGYRAILLPGSPFDGGFVEWLDKRGGAFVAIGAPVGGATVQVGYPGADSPLVALLAETTATELLAAELWRRSLE
jgi:D-arabinose 5-phosphate isomerase GutQ